MMELLRRWFAPMTVSALGLALVAGGCSSEPGAVEVTPNPDGLQAELGPEDEGFDEIDAVVLTDDQIETIRQLPNAEADLALIQKICPATDEPLGSMGVPVKVDVNGTDVFVCCAGCEGSITEDPEGTLARVPQGRPDFAMPTAPAAEDQAPEGEDS